MSRALVHFGSPAGASYGEPDEEAPKPFVHFGTPDEVAK